MIRWLGLLLFVTGTAHAACSGSSPTRTAASCSLSDVQDCITAASAGDTINVPAGTCSWSGGLTISGVKLIGAGKSATTGTIITAGTVTVTKHSTQNTRLSGFRFTGSDNHAEIGGTSSNKPYIVDNNYFAIGSGDTIHITANGGLLYQNEFYSASGSSSDTMRVNLGVSAGGDSWTAAHSMGTADTNGDQNIYFEDNTWTNFLEISLDCDNGARIVARYNTLIDSSFTAHGGGSGTSGNDTSSVGCRHFEVYNNTFDRVSNSWAVNKWLWMRGSSGVFANNTLEDASSPDGSSYPNKPEVYLTVGCPGSYPVRYAVGQSTDSADATPDNPFLIFGNTGAGASSGNFIAISENPNNSCGSPSSYIQSGRDYATSNTWGWTAYTYPHPLRSSTLPAPQRLRWRPMNRKRRRQWLRA